MSHHESTETTVFRKRVARWEDNAHENEPRHPFIRHTLRQVVCHENIQQELQKRAKHVEHAEEVKERDGNAENMFEPDRWDANEHASEWVRNEQAKNQLRTLKSELTRFGGFERGALYALAAHGSRSSARV